MSKHRTPLRIAIAQMPMHWTCEENVATILNTLAEAAGQGAELCVFPELAVTGFHHQIKAETRRGPVRAALKKIQASCREHHLACVVGTPMFEPKSPPFNSHVHIDEKGKIRAAVSKIGLTPGEAQFFAPGSDRPVAQLQGRACTSVICREVEDLEIIETQVPKRAVDIIFWPSYVGKLPNDPPDFEGKYLRLAQDLARQSAAWVIQCNWPHALNQPGGTNMGESAVIDARGEVLFRLPTDQAGLAIFTLGEKNYAWSKARS